MINNINLIKIEELSQRLKIVENTYDKLIAAISSTAIVSILSLIAPSILNFFSINSIALIEASIAVFSASAILIPISALLTGMVHLEKNRIKKKISKINKDLENNKPNINNQQNLTNTKKFEKNQINVLRHLKLYIQKNKHIEKSQEKTLVFEK